MEMEQDHFHGLKLLAHCGGGAFGEVYYCQDISGQRLALKIVSKKKLGDSWGRELKGVINYRRITGNAPELLQLFHVEEDEEHFFYTMEAADSVSAKEYVPDTLAGRLGRGPLPQEEVFGVLAAICSGIRTIHDAGFAHRDIKPDNILFVRGIPKLGDIGLTSSATTLTTQFAGTIDFLPPEVRTSGSIGSPDKKSLQRNDLYAFGKVIYCAVTGREPQAWPTIPKELPLTLPLKLFLRLSLRLCAKDPTRRIRNIGELEKEFSDIKRKLETGETFRDKAEYFMKSFLLSLRSDGIHFVSFFRRHWPFAVVLLMLAAPAAWYYRFRQSPAGERTPASAEQRSVHVAREDGMKKYFNDEIGISLTVPDSWEIVSAETVARLKAEANDKNRELTEQERKKLEFFVSMQKPHIEIIYMDFFRMQDSIWIDNSPGMESLFHKSADELRTFFRDSLIAATGFEPFFYEVKKTTFKDLPCLYFDQLVSEDLRLVCFIFEGNGKCFSITLSCSPGSYAASNELFSQVMQTMKFEKKNDPVSEKDSPR